MLPVSEAKHPERAHFEMATRVGTPIGKSKQDFRFGPWTIVSEKGHILRSDEAENLSKELKLPQIPEMTFGENRICISHSNGFSVDFNAVDALRVVDNSHDLIKVAVSREWLESRKDCEFINNTVRPFDWTYTTGYKGTVHGSPEHLKVEETSERINIEKLKAHEKIAFFEQVILFEDELADHGCAELSVKIRVMPSCFFLLMRFFLRVDGLLARIHDTRLFHECGKTYVLREYCEKERFFKDMKQITPTLLTDPTKMDKCLMKKKERYEKLSFGDVRGQPDRGHGTSTTGTSEATAITSSAPV